MNATADPTNRLAVASDAALFNHDSDDHRLKMNKAASSNTCSLLCQHGFSSRAEFGLASSDDLTVRVSPDGSS